MGSDQTRGHTNRTKVGRSGIGRNTPWCDRKPPPECNFRPSEQTKASFRGSFVAPASVFSGDCCSTVQSSPSFTRPGKCVRFSQKLYLRDQGQQRLGMAIISCKATSAVQITSSILIMSGTRYIVRRSIWRAEAAPAPGPSSLKAEGRAAY